MRRPVVLRDIVEGIINGCFERERETEATLCCGLKHWFYLLSLKWKDMCKGGIAHSSVVSHESVSDDSSIFRSGRLQ